MNLPTRITPPPYYNQGTRTEAGKSTRLSHSGIDLCTLKCGREYQVINRASREKCWTEVHVLIPISEWFRDQERVAVNRPFYCLSLR